MIFVNEERLIMGNNTANYKGSQAFNQFLNIKEQVNSSTGSLILNFPLVQLNGITQSINLDFSLIYTGSKNSILSLPSGWEFNMSYLLLRDGSGTLTTKGKTYIIDLDWADETGYKSGLKYVNNHGYLFKQVIPAQPLPSGNPGEYSYFMTYEDGSKDYFDALGKLLEYADRFENYIYYTYNDQFSGVFNNYMISIKDSFKQEITFGYGANQMRITLPDQKKWTIIYTNQGIVQIINPLQQVTTLEYQIDENESTILMIDYPHGLQTNLEYTSIPYLNSRGEKNTRSAVSKLIHTDSTQNNRIVNYTKYTYGYSTNQYFTGYPIYQLSGDSDSLIESNNPGFLYDVLIDKCDKDGRRIFSAQLWYNYLHNLITHKQYEVNDAEQATDYLCNQYTYPMASPDKHERTVNFNKPQTIENSVWNPSSDKYVQLSKSTYTYNEYGKPLEEVIYKRNKETKSFSLISKHVTSYYDSYFGIPQTKEVYDYTSGDVTKPIIRKSTNTLTPDHKNIEETMSGFFMKEEGKEVFTPYKKSTFTYDDFGRGINEKLEWNDGNLHELQSTEKSVFYDLNSYILKTISRDVQKNKSIVESDIRSGKIINQIDVLGYKVSYTYDPLGRKLTETDAMGVITKWVHDDEANKITKIEANGYSSSIYYDGMGRTIKTSDNVGSASERILSTKSYNDRNQLVSEEGILGGASKVIYTYNNKGEIETSTDVLGNITRYQYDPVQQVKTIFFNDKKLNQATYNYNSVEQNSYSTTSPNDSVNNIQCHNAYNKVINESLQHESSESEIAHDYSYDYGLNVSRYNTVGSDNIEATHSIKRDLFSNPIIEEVEVKNSFSKSEAKGNLYVYDTLNQLLQERNPLGQICSYVYDSGGRQTSYIDYAKTVFASTYNANNQVTSLSYKDKYGKFHEKKFSYVGSTHQLESLEKFVDGQNQGTIKHTYTLDRKLETLTYPDGEKVSFDYDEEKGLLTSSIDAFGQINLYTYDEYGRPTRVEIKDSSYYIGISYYSKKEDPATSGKIKSIVTNNGIEKIYKYDGFGAVQKLTVIDNNIKDENNIFLETVYTYDNPTRNIAKIIYTSTVSPEDDDLNYISQYTYNSLDQLITEQTFDKSNKLIKTIYYTYDAANNIFTEEVIDENKQGTLTSYKYDEDNKLIAIVNPSKTIKLTYDENGNLIDNGEGKTFTYDEENNLISFNDSEKNTQVEYTYYPNGLRSTKKSSDEDLIKFYYDGDTNPNILNEVQRNKHTSYLMTSSDRYLRLIHENSHQIASQCFIDNLKDIVGTINASNKCEKTYKYDPYGQQTHEGTTTVLDIMENPFKYNSEYTDSESNLIYLRSRYYNPEIKRFMTRDVSPLLNHYNYGNGNPIMGTDPSGAIFGIDDFLVSLLISTAIGTAVGGTIGGAMTQSWKGVGYGALAGAVGGAVSFTGGTTITGGLAFAGYSGEGTLAGTLVGIGTGAASEAAGGAAGQAAADAVGDHGSIGQAALFGVFTGSVVGGVSGYKGSFEYYNGRIGDVHGTQQFGRDVINASREERSSLIEMVEPRRLNTLTHRGKSWGRVGNSIRDPGGMHEWLPVQHTARWRALGYTIEDISSPGMRSATNATEFDMSGNGNWMHHNHTGGHTFYNQVVGEANSVLSLHRIIRGVAPRIRVNGVAGIGGLPADFQGGLPPIKRIIRMPFSIAYGTQGRAWF